MKTEHNFISRLTVLVPQFLNNGITLLQYFFPSLKLLFCEFTKSDQLSKDLLDNSNQSQPPIINTFKYPANTSLFKKIP